MNMAGQPKKKTLSLDSGIVNNFFESWVTLNQNIFMPSTCLVSRSALAAVGGFVPGLIYMEDSYCWIRIGLRYEVFFINKVLASYTNDDPLSAVRTLRHKPILTNHLSWINVYSVDKKKMLKHPWAIKFVQLVTYERARVLWSGGYRLKALFLLANIPRPLSWYGLHCIVSIFLEKLRLRFGGSVYGK